MPPARQLQRIRGTRRGSIQTTSCLCCDRVFFLTHDCTTRLALFVEGVNPVIAQREKAEGFYLDCFPSARARHCFSCERFFPTKRRQSPAHEGPPDAPTLSHIRCTQTTLRASHRFVANRANDCTGCATMKAIVRVDSRYIVACDVLGAILVRALYCSCPWFAVCPLSRLPSFTV